MVYAVGPKGQIVIAKEIRDRLGLEPGWVALQRLVDDHVEVYFLPPEHRRSMKGSLAGHIKSRVGPGGEWDSARRDAWASTARERASSADTAE